MAEIDYTEIIAAMYRIVGATEKRLDDLREADHEATLLAHAELSERLAGFPQAYATKAEMEEAARLLRKMDKDKLESSVFSTFVENYRIQQEQAAQDRREVVEVLSRATENVRAQLSEEQGDLLTQELYEVEHNKVVTQIQAVERWQYKIVGGLIFATFVAPLVTGTIVYFLTKQIAGG